jgi:acetyltransferase-like isoleucine patch superfamily enzyme
MYTHSMNWILRNSFRMLRQFFTRIYISRLRACGSVIGVNVRFIGDVFVFGDERNLCIKNNTTINHGCVLNCYDKLEIGSNCHISAGVNFHTSSLGIKITDRVHVSDAIFIGDSVWLGANVIVLKGVSIGEGSVIAAGAVISKSIPERSLVDINGNVECIN